ncbi:MAG TPA: NAD-dependent epimerase/dehydratase family protein [Vicinamibacterales bacterium]
MTSPSTFLVTGGNGYLGAWIVRTLLDAGHTVRTTVRDAVDSARYRHLHDMAAAAAGRLTLHRAALTDREAFQTAASGCTYVIHSASPFTIDLSKDPQRDIVDPAIAGTRNVLEAVNAVDSVRRVVLTSSIAATYGDAVEARNRGGRPFTEADWNTTSSIHHQPYPFSKAEAERTAWEIARRQSRWDLVVLNPGFILGPAIAPDTPGVSQTVMTNLARGVYRQGIPDIWYGIVDVRDVARAHMLACIMPEANGRYLLVAESESLWGIARRLRAAFGDAHPLPARKAPKPLLWLMAPQFGFTRRYVTRNVGHPISFDNTKSRRELKMEYTPIDTTLRDHFAQVAGV